MVDNRGFSVLEKRLYSEANKIIGIMGERTCTPFSVTREPYLSILARFKKSSQVLPYFKKLIRSYCFFVKEVHLEGESIVHKKRLKIYWRRIPGIERSNGFIYLNARLLISRKHGEFNPRIRSVRNGE